MTPYPWQNADFEEWAQYVSNNESNAMHVFDQYAYQVAQAERKAALKAALLWAAELCQKYEEQAAPWTLHDMEAMLRAEAKKIK